MSETLQPLRVVRLSSAQFVGIGIHGPMLPASGDHPAAPLDHHDLGLLRGLVAGCDPDELVSRMVQDGAPRPRLEATLSALFQRGRLVELVERPFLSPPPAVDWDADLGAPIAPGRRLRLLAPLTLQPVEEGFLWPSHGEVGVAGVVFDETETMALTAFLRPRDLIGAKAQADRLLEASLDAKWFEDLVGRARHVGLLDLVADGDVDDEDAAGTADRIRRFEQERAHRLFRAVDEAEDARRAANAKLPTRRTAVVPVCFPPHQPNLALGLIFAHARVYKDGLLERRYDLQPRWLVRKANAADVVDDVGAAIYLFSDYIWSSPENLEISRRVKALSPTSLTIHGGPDVPRHPEALERWMRAHPEVDVAVRNEGELPTAEILELLDGDVDRVARDPDILSTVAGITYRRGDEFVRTPDRERLVDLSVTPSPYLTGVFDPWEDAGIEWFILETNRGCPYGCTFCDWGQATMSRIRKFELDRIFEEIEFAGRSKSLRMMLADANFGIFSRDVEIAEKVAEVRRATGYPREFHAAFAKNTNKYVAPIVKTLIDAGVIASGTISLQTFDQPTLDAVDRSNIRNDKYEELLAFFRSHRMPITAELMVGLPGSTLDSFCNDLQRCCDLEVSPRMYRTLVLVNSPMNEPDYRERWQIRTDAETSASASETGYLTRWFRPADTNALVVSTATYTKQDLDVMMRLRDVYTALESFDLLRHVARWVRQETGVREVDLYRLLDDRTAEAPESYPVLRWVLDTIGLHSTAPLHWESFLGEVRRFVIDECSAPDDSALDAVISAQGALLPARGRRFPDRVSLPHDVVGWHAAMMSAKDAGADDWTAVAPRLISFPPGELVVEDPTAICTHGIGVHFDPTSTDNWELGSPVARALPPRHQTV